MGTMSNTHRNAPGTRNYELQQNKINGSFPQTHKCRQCHPHIFQKLVFPGIHVGRERNMKGFIPTLTRTNAKKLTTKGKELCIRRTSAHLFEGVRDQGRRRNKTRREKTDKWSRGKRRTQRIEENEIIRSGKENLDNCSRLPPAPTPHHFSRALPVLVLIRGQVVGCHFCFIDTSPSSYETSPE